MFKLMAENGNSSKPLLVAVFSPLEYAYDNWGETMNYMSDEEIEEIHEYDNKSDLENFIVSRCRAEDNVDQKQKTYFVDDIPFFLHNYEIEMSNVMQEDRDYVLRANYGSYAYL